jgi:hypothetical protein
MLFLMMIFISASVFSQIPTDQLKTNIDEFSKDMASVLPFYSTIGLNWSDAYIGQINGLPPHFGIGVSSGFTSMNFTNFKKVLNDSYLNASFARITSYILPTYTAEARIGGAGIPFDFGVKFGLIPSGMIDILFPEINFENMLIGGDIRFALVASKVIPMRFSIGAGFNYLSGGVNGKPAKMQLKYGALPTEIIDLDNPEVNIDWQTKSIEVKTQISLPYRIITPYLGVGAILAWSQVDYGLKTTLSPTAQDDLKGTFSSVNGNGFQITHKEDLDFNTRIFGGLSFNIAYLRIDLAGMYEFLSNHYGATFGIRFQL